jgi:hypothetical protein
MALCVIKQEADETIEVYYEWILKLTNCMQHKANDNMLITFLIVGWLPYLLFVTTWMEWNMFLWHKEMVVTSEKNIGDVPITKIC